MLNEKCTLNELFIEQFLDNELDYSESSQIASHIKNCSRCTKIYNELKLVKNVVREFGESQSLSAIEKEGFRNLINNIDKKQGFSEWIKNVFLGKRAVVAFSTFAMASFIFLFTFVLFRTDHQNNFLIHEIISAHSNDLPDEFNEMEESDLVIGKRFKINKDLVKVLHNFSPSVRGRFTSIGNKPAAQIRLGKNNRASLFLSNKSNNKLKELFKDSKCISRNIRSECNAHLRQEDGKDMVFWEKPDKDYVLVSNDTDISSKMVRLISDY